MSATIATREPFQFAIGDTLIFQRYLADYLPPDGWALTYEIRGGASAVSNPVTFSSTTSGSYHLINVAAETTATWLAGDYDLAGYAVLASTGERHQIFRAQLTLQANLGAGDDAPVTTHAQRMIPLLEAQLERLAAHELDSTNIQQTEIQRVKRETLLGQLKYYRELRAHEIAVEQVRNGFSSGRIIPPTFKIT